MKTLGIILVTIVGIVGLIVGAAFYATRGMTDVADSFIGAWSVGQPHASYVYLSPEFTRATNEQQLHQVMQQMGLTSIVSTNWTNRSVNNGIGLISGTAVRRDRTTVNLEVSLLKNGDQWKILNFRATAGGVVEPKSQQHGHAYHPVPRAAE